MTKGQESLSAIHNELGQDLVTIFPGWMDSTGLTWRKIHQFLSFIQRESSSPLPAVAISVPLSQMQALLAGVRKWWEVLQLPLTISTLGGAQSIFVTMQKLRHLPVYRSKLISSERSGSSLLICEYEARLSVSSSLQELLFSKKELSSG